MKSKRMLDSRSKTWKMYKISRIISTHKRNSRQSSRIDNSKTRPAIQKSDKVTIDLPQINIRTTSRGIHRTQLGIQHSPKQRDYTTHQPDDHQSRRRTKLTRHR